MSDKQGLALRDAEPEALGAVSDGTAHLSPIGADRGHTGSVAQVRAPDRKLHLVTDDGRVALAHGPTAREQIDLHFATPMHKFDMHAFSIDPVAGEVRYRVAAPRSLQAELFRQ